MGKPNLSYSGNHKVLIESFNDMSTINNLVPFSIRYADLCKFFFVCLFLMVQFYIFKLLFYLQWLDHWIISLLGNVVLFKCIMPSADACLFIILGFIFLLTVQQLLCL